MWRETETPGQNFIIVVCECLRFMAARSAACKHRNTSHDLPSHKLKEKYKNIVVASKNGHLAEPTIHDTWIHKNKTKMKQKKKSPPKLRPITPSRSSHQTCLCRAFVFAKAIICVSREARQSSSL